MCTRSIASQWHIICEEKPYTQLMVIFLHWSTWIYTKMFQTYTDQTESFECEERDQQSQNNEECLEDKVQSKF